MSNISTLEPQCLLKKREDLKKKFKKAGANLPALARRDYDFMQCIQTDKGYKMASYDFVSLEPSVSAAWSNDPMYKYATCDGIGKKPFISRDGVLMIDDLYLMFSTQLPKLGDIVREAFIQHNLFDVWMDPEDPDHDKVKKHPKLKKPRDISKTAALGLERGMGAEKLVADIHKNTGTLLSVLEAKAIISNFWEFFEGLNMLRNKLAREVEKKGYFYTNPFGFKVNCDSGHKAYAYFTQAQAAGVINLLLFKFFTLAKYARFHALIHDELIFSYPETEEERMRHDMDACLVSLNNELNWSVPMRLSGVTGYNFGDMK